MACIVQISSFVFLGRPEFLPTTAGSLCRTPHSGQKQLKNSSAQTGNLAFRQCQHVQSQVCGSGGGQQEGGLQVFQPAAIRVTYSSQQICSEVRER